MNRPTIKPWLSSRALLASLLAMLAGCGGGGSAPTEPPPATGALAASRSGELVSYVREQLRARDRQRGTGQAAGAAPGWLDAVATVSGTVQRSSTLLQEEGVDEEDLLKSRDDASVIYTLAAGAVYDGDAPYALLGVVPRAGDGTLGTPAVLGIGARRTAGQGTVNHGMLLVQPASRVAVFSEAFDAAPLPDCPPVAEVCATVLPFAPGPSQTQVLIQLVNVADPARPTAAEQYQIDGRLVGVRRIGQQLYVVSTFTPVLAYDRLPATASTAEREAALAALGAGDVLPRLSINGGEARPLLSETDCYVQPANAIAAVELTTITVIDLAATTPALSSRCFVGATEALYMSQAAMYLATTRVPLVTDGPLRQYATTMSTDVHKFALDGTRIDYRGSGTVEGHLGWDRQKMAYRLSEHQGDLRVLSFTGAFGWAVPDDPKNGSTPPSPARLTILRERTTDRSLQVVSTLPNERRPALLGKPGEQLYAVRFAGDRGYAVTFRQLDPLIVLDLADPADPRLAGELVVPGFSDHLFPLPGGLLFGVGKDATNEGRLLGLKVALFDVRDPAQPAQLAAQSLGSLGSFSALDLSRHGIDILQRGPLARIALPVALFDGSRQVLRHGVQRFEVDTSARALRMLELIESPPGALGLDLGTERTMQVDDHLYWLSGGKLTAHAWTSR